jgi:hypothetical protein
LIQDSILSENIKLTNIDIKDIVKVPQMNFLMVDGEGDPNTSKSFSDAIESLYPLSYMLKFMVKNGELGSNVRVRHIMNPQNDSFYSRIPTLSNDELFNYITHYSRFKLEAVQLAVTELRRRGFILSDDELTNIEAFFNLKSNKIRRPPYVNPGLFRLISYVIFCVGLLISVVIYVIARPPMEHPFGFNPLNTKIYLRQLELLGGKGNIMAAEFMEWFVGLWQGKNLSYTIACITVIISMILWFMGSRKRSDPDKNLVNPRD